jgi:hypothetical protein
MGHLHIKGRNGYVISHATTLPTLAIPSGTLASTATVLLVASTSTGNVTDTGGNALTQGKFGTVTAVNTQTPFTPSTSWHTVGGAALNGLTSTGTVYVTGTGDYTVEAFIRITSYNSNGHVIFDQTAFNGVGGRQNGQLFWVYNSGYLAVFQNGNYQITSAAASVTLNTWHHVALTRQSGTSSLWINGNRVAQNSNMAGANFTVTTCQIGRAGDVPATTGYSINGYLSNWRFVNGLAVYNKDSTTYTVPTADLSVPSQGISYTNSNYGIWRLN